MKNLFNSVKLQRPKSSMFDLSHERKLSCNMGELIPIMVNDVVPGDKFKVNTEILVRFAPMIAPMMHRVNVYTHYFFVPNRLVYTEWENFITGGADGLSAPAFPYIQTTNALKANMYKGTLWDYMGLPVTSATAIPGSQEAYINALPFRAYQLIYNEFYRDQTLQTAIALTKNTTVDATETAAICALRNRCWEKDYLTSAQNNTQRGGEVMLPNAPDYKAVTNFVKSAGGNPTTGAATFDSVNYPQDLLDGSGSASVNVENLDGINISINDLRRASRLQAWLERNQIGGSRYVEQILSHFGVTLPDFRAYRPVYLGGGKQNVVISEVLNTTGTTGQLPQGNMAGHGVSVGNTNSFKYSFPEHGWVIGIMSVLPRTAYQEGIQKKFMKTSDKYAYFWPEFANIGEQVVYNGEAKWDFTGATNNSGTFGYQSRYSEYKYEPSTVHGDFRDTLAYWHMGRIFTSQPALNAAFVSSDPTHRVFAVTDTQYDKLYIQVYNNVKAIRPMPKYGSPGIHIM